MKTLVHSSRLQFTRDGRTLVVAEPDAVTLVELRDATRRQIAIPGVQAVAAFAEQVWVATQAGAVLRLTRDGRQLDEHPVPPDPDALLIPTTIGALAALWTAREPVALVDDLGSLAILGHPIDAAISIPLAGRRFAHGTGPRLTLPAGRAVTLANGAQLTGGSAVFEGASLMLVAEHPRGRDIVILALASARTLQTMALPPGLVRLAARRGLAVVHAAPRRLAVIDLRFARHLGAVVTDDDVTDVAIDPDGSLLAIRLARGDLELAPIGERMGALARLAVVSGGPSGHTPNTPAPDATTTKTSELPPKARSEVATRSRLAELPPVATPRSSPADVPRSSPADVPQSSPADAPRVFPPDVSLVPPPDAPRVPPVVVPLAPPSDAPCVPPADVPRPTVVVLEAVPSETQTSELRSPESSPSKARIAVAWPSEIPASTDRPPGAALPVIVDALDPRPIRTRLPRAEALVELDREICSVIAWTLCAISMAWDTRRLGYGNEGHHPYEHEVAALVGKNAAGFAQDYLAAAEAALAEHEALLAADPHYRGPATPIAELIDELGLSPAAVDVLLVIAAPSLNGDVARLYGILGNDPGRALVDEALVDRVLGNRVSRHDIAAELHPRAPLVRLGIVGVKPSRPRPFAALTVDPAILSRLRGEPPDLGVALIERHAARTLEAIELAPGVLAAATDALAQAARPARIAVRGRTGTGRRTLLAAFAHHAGRSLGVIDATVLPRDAERFVGELEAALRRAQLAGLVPAIHGLDAVVLDQRSGTELAHETLAAHPGPLAVLLPPGATPPLPVGHVVIDLPALSETERLGVWQRALDGTGRWLRDAAGLASRYRVGPGIIHRAVAAAAGHDLTTPCDDRIDAFLRQSRDLRLADHARRVDRLASWADLVLPSDIMDSLRELVGRVRHRRTVFEDWGMARAMATSRGLTALFQGQPGTGKTLVAGVIARELGLDLYQVDLSKVMSKWIGETERNLAAIFDAAEDGQVILLFDEADALFAKRTEVRSSNDRYANLEVNYLLQRLDQFEGIAILTTNSGGSIDPAFKRRLSFQLSFPFPDEDTRAELWRAHLPRELPRTGELTFDALARKYQLSGGYIRNACLRAAFLAAQEETSLHQHHLERAVALEFAELGKLSTTGTIA